MNYIFLFYALVTFKKQHLAPFMPEAQIQFGSSGQRLADDNMISWVSM